MDIVQDFHDQLENLASAGIRFDLGTCASRHEPNMVSRLQSEWRLLRSQSLPSEMTQDIELYLSRAAIPSAYKRALELWLQNEHVAALEVLTIPVLGIRLKQRSYWLVALQSIFLMSAVFVTLAGVCIYLVPIFSNLQQQSFRPAGPGLQGLQWLRAWLPVWGIGVPILFSLFLLFQKTFFRSLWSLSRSNNGSSFALAELQSSLSAPARLPIVANIAILLCGAAVIVVVYGIYGTTIELLLNILRDGTRRL